MQSKEEGEALLFFFCSLPGARRDSCTSRVSFTWTYVIMIPTFRVRKTSCPTGFQKDVRRGGFSVHVIRGLHAFPSPRPPTVHLVLLLLWSVAKRNEEQEAATTNRSV